MLFPGEARPLPVARQRDCAITAGYQHGNGGSISGAGDVAGKVI